MSGRDKSSSSLVEWILLPCSTAFRTQSGRGISSRLDARGTRRGLGVTVPGRGQGRVESHGLDEILPRLLGPAERGLGQGAVVKAARRVGRGTDADTEGGHGVRVAPASVGT